jgi:predicted PurR-regulated permease PerM
MPTDKDPAEPVKNELPYTVRVWQTIAIVSLFITILLVVRVAFNVLLMALAGCLIAVYFHGLGDLIQRKTRITRRFAMLYSIAGTLVIIALSVWFIGAKIQIQVAELSNTLPETIRVSKTKLNSTPLGRKVLDYTSGQQPEKILDTATAFFNTGFGVLGDLYIILFLGLFFTASPTLYKEGILLLVPQPRKAQGIQIIDRISRSLRGWLRGMLVSMILITVLITVGLMIIGIPLTMVLGLITGILEIVPNFGPLIAMIPGVLLAITVSTNTAIFVALLYIICQTIVANIATPLLQKKIIHLPPALTLISQLLMGVLSGVLGIILAVPLLAILMILIDELYIKKIDSDLVSAS